MLLFFLTAILAFIKEVELSKTLLILIRMRILK